MPTDLIVEPSRQVRDCALEISVLERADAAAPVAHQMVVMLSTRMGRLVADGSLAYVEALDQVQLVEELERPVDGGDAHVAAIRSELVGYLAGAEHAPLAAQHLHDRRTWSARAMPRALQLLLRVGSPFRGGQARPARVALHALDDSQP